MTYKAVRKIIFIENRLGHPYLWYAQSLFAWCYLFVSIYMIFILYKAFSMPGNESYFLSNVIFPVLPGMILMLIIAVGSLFRFSLSLLISVLSIFDAYKSVALFIVNYYPEHHAKMGSIGSMTVTYGIMDMLNPMSVLFSASVSICGIILFVKILYNYRLNKMSY